MEVQPAPAPGSDIVVSGGTGPEIAAAAPAATAPVSAEAPASGQQHDGTLTPAIAKLFAPTGIVDAGDLNVSYRVLSDHEIVTVFTDPKTGKEVTQVPSEAMIGLAEFFDQHQGVTFDKSA